MRRALDIKESDLQSECIRLKQLRHLLETGEFDGNAALEEGGCGMKSAGQLRAEILALVKEYSRVRSGLRKRSRRVNRRCCTQAACSTKTMAIPGWLTSSLDFWLTTAALPLQFGAQLPARACRHSRSGVA